MPQVGLVAKNGTSTNLRQPRGDGKCAWPLQIDCGHSKPLHNCFGNMHAALIVNVLGHPSRRIPP